MEPIRDDAGLRQRVSGKDGVASSTSAIHSAEHVGLDTSASRSKKTYGRTPDGTVFVVPTTHDMVSQLFDPRQPKNLSDALVVIVLALHIFAAYALPQSLKQPVFAAVFLFWRAAYNLGIGLLLSAQSNHKSLVTWAQRWNLFVHPSTGKNPRPWLYNLLKREMEAKIPEDYKFDKAPIEYNTWLVFRRVVDLILMCDFVSYCLFAIICARTPPNEGLGLFLGRWIIGVALFGFNLWVKLDAHRVVKDYAWYWGDFFYLIDQELTFDGVFELAPHPMYSIGYAGYYGISAMAASYDVLFISIVAHVAQMVFLTVVENPHIEKIYDPPQPRVRSIPGAQGSSTSKAEDAAAQAELWPAHNLVGLKNLDLFRSPDYTSLLLVFYIGIISIVAPNTIAWKAIFVANAILWRLWYSIGLGVILTKQSKEKMFTRHFVKYGESAGEAWRQWKSLSYFSMILCNASFAAACWKMYALPEDWSYGWAILRHVTGCSLIALHVWTTVSIYDSLGEFGWFFGDFFYEQKSKLTYKSIYRFLNNPERVMGLAGLWGAALITWSRSILLLAIVSQILLLGFIEYVEKPHMQKIYGSRNIREEAGLTKFFRKSLPPPVKELSLSVDKVLDNTKNFVDEFVEGARPMLASGVSNIVRDTTRLFNNYPARLTLSRIPPDLAGFNPSDYSITVQGSLSASSHSISERATGKESLEGRIPKEVKTIALEYGGPIHVKWRAPANHSKKDWIGLYMVTDNRSRDVTEVPSLGRWIPTSPGHYGASDSEGIITADVPVLPPPPPSSSSAPTSSSSSTSSSMNDVDLVQGEMVFAGDKLWWTQGVFEFRYHHSGNHHVMSISEPFEVRISRFDDGDGDADADESEFTSSPPAPDSHARGTYERAIAAALLPIVQNCLDRNPDIAPQRADEPFGSHVERDSKYAKRVVYAVRNMFGIEFAPAVVPADGNVRRLAWRICNAKQVLAPYSMSHSKGPTTPVMEKEELGC